MLDQSQELRKIVLYLYFNQEGINWTYFKKSSQRYFSKLDRRNNAQTPIFGDRLISLIFPYLLLEKTGLLGM